MLGTQDRLDAFPTQVELQRAALGNLLRLRGREHTGKVENLRALITHPVDRLRPAVLRLIGLVVLVCIPVSDLNDARNVRLVDPGELVGLVFVVAYEELGVIERAKAGSATQQEL